MQHLPRGIRGQQPGNLMPRALLAQIRQQLGIVSHQQQLLQIRIT